MVDSQILHIYQLVSPQLLNRFTRLYEEVVQWYNLKLVCVIGSSSYFCLKNDVVNFILCLICAWLL